jgi:antitoxin (DNA-binding transcriptional repressor) of toxin-antitoxin stability system
MYRIIKRNIMKTVNFTEFRNNASLFLSAVEKGEIVLVMRHGKAIAKISPPESKDDDQPSWKKPALRLVAKGKNLSSAILEERELS